MVWFGSIADDAGSSGLARFSSLVLSIEAYQWNRFGLFTGSRRSLSKKKVTRIRPKTVLKISRVYTKFKVRSLLGRDSVFSGSVGFSGVRLGLQEFGWIFRGWIFRRRTLANQLVLISRNSKMLLWYTQNAMNKFTRLRSFEVVGFGLRLLASHSGYQRRSGEEKDRVSFWFEYPGL